MTWQANRPGATSTASSINLCCVLIALPVLIASCRTSFSGALYHRIYDASTSSWRPRCIFYCESHTCLDTLFPSSQDVGLMGTYLYMAFVTYQPSELSGKVLAIGRPLMIANSVMLHLDKITFWTRTRFVVDMTLHKRENRSFIPCVEYAYPYYLPLLVQFALL